MDSFLEVALVLGFAAAATIFVVWLWRASSKHVATLRLQGFAPRHSAPPAVQQIRQKLFGKRPRSGAYQGGDTAAWDDTAWWVEIDTGGDDPITHALAWTQDMGGCPNLAVVQTVGVTKTTGLVSMLGIRSQFQKAGMHLLPDELQLFLSRRQGLVLYSSADTDLRNVLPRSLLEALNAADADVSFAALDGWLVLWTAGFFATANVFRIASLIRNELAG